MTASSDDRERASREQQAWESIVADLSGQLDIPLTGPADDRGPTMADRDAAFVEALLEDEPSLELQDDDSTGSYHPPDPGPIPLPADAISRASWAAAIGGPLLVTTAFVLHLGTFIAGIGVVSFICGFVALVIRLPDRDRGEDDGAVV